MVQFFNNGLKTEQEMSVYGLNYPYSNGLPNQVIRPFENRARNHPKSEMFGFQVFGIQMVTVVQFFEWLKVV